VVYSWKRTEGRLILSSMVGRSSENEVRNGGQRHGPTEPFGFAQRESLWGVGFVVAGGDLGEESINPDVGIRIVIKGINYVAHPRSAGRWTWAVKCEKVIQPLGTRGAIL